MKIQKLSHLMNRYLPSLGLALLIAIPIYTPAHASHHRSDASKARAVDKNYLGCDNVPGRNCDQEGTPAYGYQPIEVPTPRNR